MRKVVPGSTVTLSPEPSFTERLYEKRLFLVGGLPSSPRHFLPSVSMRKVVPGRKVTPL